MSIAISIVEDQRALRESLVEWLGNAPGIRCVGAYATAEEALRGIPAQKPDVVLMDINLPGMSGLDALRAMRDAPETKDIPVIALTAAASERDKQRGMQAGFYRYLTKPVKVDELVTALEGVLAATT